MRRAALCLALFALCLAARERPLAQSSQPAGVAITGSIVDGRLQPVADVLVSLTRAGIAPRTQRTDAQGRFRFENVPPGTYRVRAERNGFTPVSRELVVRTTSLQLPLVIRSTTPESEQRKTAPDVMTPRPAPPAAAAPPPPPAPGGVGFGTGTGIGAGSGGGTGGGSYAPSRVAAGGQGGIVGGNLTIASPSDGSANTAAYAHVEANRFKLVSDDPLSTFAADVDTASYTNVRRFLNHGQLPPPDAVRIEELLNYFRFDYPPPVATRPVSITTEVGDCPWAPAHKLVLVGMKAKTIEQREVGGRNIVLLVDVSGSMQPANRLPLIKSALRMFVDTLRDQDHVAMVVYAGASGLALPPTPGYQRERIHDAIEALNAGGSTNGAEGLVLAYRVARESYVPGGINRVILATDGDFNVGITSQGDLLQLIQRERETGVFLSVLGVGDNNLKDSTMEMLADKGNGHYSYLDSLAEARRVLVREGGATLETVAKDVKFQVEFNPAVVAAWKLIGYENRILQHQEFNDDTRDGGELGAGHTVTVLYEIVPAGGALPEDVQLKSGRPIVDPLIYQTARRPNGGARDLLMVKVRYKLPSASESQLMTQPVKGDERARNLAFAGAVAEFGMLLKDSKPRREEWATLVSRTQSMKQALGSTDDCESFIELVARASGLKRQRN